MNLWKLINDYDGYLECCYVINYYSDIRKDKKDVCFKKVKDIIKHIDKFVILVNNIHNKKTFMTL